eukprot:TRINITY_DN4621_c0_g1_i1.p3 TRINITY_DN4621_c0_g1~~TRINITY_DN4621_c0_g1_i1.p3  ORF type:complete len:68 (-),score=10.21 TRINITY_DN4621_c0_g1_i1:71-274(-)
MAQLKDWDPCGSKFESLEILYAEYCHLCDESLEIIRFVIPRLVKVFVKNGNHISENGYLMLSGVNVR